MTTNGLLHRVFVLAAILIVLLATLPARAASEATDACVVAAVPEAFALPDGTKAEPGSLELCFTREYSPAAGLHELRVDGRPVGMFVSERRRTEGVTELGDAIVVLRRRADGSLALYAYAVRAGDRMVAYRLRPLDRWTRRATRSVEREDPDLATLLREPREGFTVLAVLR